MTATPDVHTAVLLIAHGSRRVEANDDARQLARQLEADGDAEIVEVAYLELATPSIPDAVRSCVARGAQRVLLLPYFLSAGTHVVEDLRGYCKQLADKNYGVAFELCPPLGLHPLMKTIVRDRLRERLG